MSTILTIIHVIVAILLTLCIVIQNRGSGLGAAFGGTGASYVQRRGAEKMIYNLSIYLSIAFFGLAVVGWFLPY